MPQHPPLANASEATARVLADIAYILASAEDVETRMRYVLELLRCLVPYEQCALLQALPNLPYRVIAVPEPPPAGQTSLRLFLTHLLGQVAESPVPPDLQAVGIAPGPWHSYLAVPLVGLDQVIGVLWVGHSASHEYVEPDLRLLSIIGAQLAVYMGRYRAHTEISQAAPASHQPRQRGAWRTTPEGLPPRLPTLIGTDPKMLELRRLIEVVARTDVPVLLTGETGTGKELVARLIHARSARTTQPFAVIDCPGIPVSLFESEVFGYERGAFTGAEARRLGRLEGAHGSTLLLDEVGELPLEVQAKLLRFLEDGQLTRVGGRQCIPVNIRVIAATNRDLVGMVAQGTFRADLFYRLKVIQLHLPPLRERTGDLPLLATHLLEQFCLSHGVAAKVLASESLARLAAYAWPGNIRELRHVLLRACLLTAECVIIPTDLALDGNDTAPPTGLAAVERQHILTVVRQAQGNITQAARVLGIHRATLYRKLEALGLCPEHLREERSERSR